MEALKNRRGGHRARATVLCKAINDELDKQEPDLEVLQMSLDELERQCNSITSLDLTIAEKTTSDDIELEISDASEKVIKIKFVISKGRKFVHNSMSESRRERGDTSKSVKLPQLTLVNFAGDPLDWLDFWELFRTSVHERADVPSPVKFQYLVGQLEGEAAKLLSGFNHTESEYTEAIDLLVTTNGQKKLLVQSRLNALFDMPMSDSTIASLRSFRSTFEGHLRVLKSLESNVKDAGYVFAQLLLRKLSITTRDNLNRAYKFNVWTLDELRTAINNEIQHLTALQDLPNEGSIGLDSNTNSRLKENSNFNSNLHTATFTVSSKSVCNNACRYCNGSHFVQNCSVYSTVKQRKSRAIELNLCYNCLRNNHTVSSCRNRANCKTCGKRHHTTLCGREQQRPSKEQKQPTIHGMSEPMQNAKTKNNQSTCTVLSANNNNNNRTLNTSILPTALAVLENKSNSVKCKILLYDGSQTTFILEDVAKQLKLIKVGSLTLEVDGFESCGQRKQYDVVEVTINTNEGKVKINAVVTPSLPNRLTMPGRSALVRKLNLKGYILADASESL